MVLWASTLRWSRSLPCLNASILPTRTLFSRRRTFPRSCTHSCAIQLRLTIPSFPILCTWSKSSPRIKLALFCDFFSSFVSACERKSLLVHFPLCVLVRVAILNQKGLILFYYFLFFIRCARRPLLTMLYRTCATKRRVRCLWLARVAWFPRATEQPGSVFTIKTQRLFFPQPSSSPSFSSNMFFFSFADTTLGLFPVPSFPSRLQ